MCFCIKIVECLIANLVFMGNKDFLAMYLSKFFSDIQIYFTRLFCVV